MITNFFSPAIPDNNGYQVINNYQKQVLSKPCVDNVSFYGNNKETRLVNRFNKLENNIFKDSFSTKKSSIKSKEIYSLAITLFNANKLNIELDFDSKKYLELSKKLLDKAENTDDFYTAGYFHACFYPYMDKKSKLGLEKFLLKQLKAGPQDKKAVQAEFFFYKVCNKQEKGLKKLANIIKKLNSIGDRTSQDYFKAREDLFSQEASILIQEITQPARYMNRALKMFAIGNMPDDKKEAGYKLQEESLSGLYVLFKTADSLNIKLNKIDLNRLSTSIIGIANNSTKEEIKTNTIKVLKVIYDKLSNDQKKEAENLGLDIIKTSQNVDLNQSVITFFNEKIDKSKPTVKKLNDIFINNYNNANNNEQKAKSLIALTKLKSEKVPAIVKSVLADNKADASLKIAATWALGFYPTTNNLRTLVNIIKNQTEVNGDKKLQIKEMALCSISEYKNDKALEVLNKVKNSNSELSGLAEVLTEKVNKSIEINGDYFLNKFIKSVTEKTAYINARNAFVEGFDDLSNNEKNILDRAFIPFRKILTSAVESGKKFIILNDTVTAINTSQRGHRFGFGFFFDCAGGLGGSNIIIPKHAFSDIKKTNGISSHEWGHLINFYLDLNKPELGNKIKDLYNNAKEKGQILDFYGANNYKEYFAQGMAAYNEQCLSHEKLMDIDNYFDHYSNTRSFLKRKDPELFNFIDSLYKDFNAQNITKDSIAIVA